MQVPKRRGEQKPRPQIDLTISASKLLRLKKELKKLIEIDQPRAAEEVHRTGLFGDFSENAEYREAKINLRRILARINNLKWRIAEAVIVNVPSNPSLVTVGTRVRTLCNGVEQTWEIVGGSEIAPAMGRISANSPLGSLLINKAVGSKVEVNSVLNKRVYEIVSIEPSDID